MRMAIVLECLFVLSLAAIASSALAQGGRGGAFGGGPAGIGGGRSSFGGGGRPSTRGLDTRSVNPNFNPPGSLTPFQNFNPSGSLSPALNLNPEGSLFRPRTSDEAYRVGRPAIRANSRRTAYRPLLPPSATQLRMMPRTSLAAWVRVGTDQLASSLAEYGNGEQWQKYLKLDEVSEAFSLDSDAKLDEASQQELSEILQRFDTVAGDEPFRPVTRLPGFGGTRSSLQEFLKASAGDERLRFDRSAKALSQALDEFAKGKGWQEYLALPSEAATDDVNGSAQPDLAIFEQLLARFESIQNDPKYGVITRLPEFRATRANLESLIQSVGEPANSISDTDD